MKKVLSKNKGFAMAELLAVCVVVLGLFSVLFSNYLPLLAEYENRLSYNDVTAEYAAHYVRKAYVENPDFRQKSKEQKTFLTSIFDQSKGYYTIYDKKNNIKDFCFGTGAGAAIINGCSELTSKLTNIIDQYKIEEIIVSRYQLGDLTGDYGKVGLKDKMEAANTGSESYNEDGLLYNYIKYLPSYAVKAERNKITTGNTDEMYRIILKTKDFGYATTSIRSNYVVKDECIIASNDSDSSGIYIADFIYSDKCIHDGIIEIKNDSTHTVERLDGDTVVGKIVGIADGASSKGAFSPGYNPKGDSKYQDDTNLKLKNIVFDEDVDLKMIGSYAFYGTDLDAVNLSSDTSDIGYTTVKKVDSSGLTIGNNAFSNISTLKTVVFDSVIDGKNVKYLNNTFSNDSSLEKVVFGNNIDKVSTSVIGTGMFSNCSSNFSEGLKLYISDSTSKIRQEMFYKTNVGDYDFSSTKLKEIGLKSFADISVSNSYTLRLPNEITKIFETAFVNNKSIKGVIFNGNNEGLDIGASAFKKVPITTLNFGSRSGIVFNEEAFTSIDLENLVIPEKSKLYSQAFSHINKLKTINVGSYTNIIANNGGIFMYNDSVECIKINSNITVPAKFVTAQRLPSKIIDVSRNFYDVSTACGEEKNGAFASARYWTLGEKPTICSLSAEDTDDFGNYKVLTVNTENTKIYTEGDC